MPQPTVQHAVDVVVIRVVVTVHIHRHLIHLLKLVAAAEQLVVENHAGLSQIHLFYILLLKYNLLHLSEKQVEVRAAQQPDLRDVFLCHAWGDRKEAAKELHDLLEAAGVKVWFSEKDLGLGVPMMRAIDKGLANSRIGLVLVTPAMLERLPKESVADKELSTLLAGNQLIPIVHNTSYEALRNVSPMLASRTGLDTSEDSMKVVAEKIAELVQI
ncbi:toll/interleukin-1 receptor domain-containing protein [Photobacterium leiognathi]|uniref:toll/interleukin-1 receptor domain-containing protein n=1 Tax=Photobacterium leiognathi TaxID=553611 RepID=UPI002980DAC2|nr:toll/interleukin-1 receptor domain-containing protein [Photobacterium leiognathi]